MAGSAGIDVPGFLALILERRRVRSGSVAHDPPERAEIIPNGARWPVAPALTT